MRGHGVSQYDCHAVLIRQGGRDTTSELDDLTQRHESALEQAALRRIATLVAEGAQPGELFAVVAAEVGQLIDVPFVGIVRYETDGTATVRGRFSSQQPSFRDETRVSIDDGTVLGLIRETAEPARIDKYAGLVGEIADAVRRASLRSTVGVPIIVSAGVWGAIVASSTRRLPENTGTRLAAFTRLLAAAIANVEARESLARLADEQAALRRVATLVARDTAPVEIFAAVSTEVDRLLGLDPATSDIAIVSRLDPGPALVVEGVSKRIKLVALGSHWPLDDLFAPTRALRSGRSERVRPEDVMSATGEMAELLQEHGYLSQVSSPIVVDGSLWGTISVTGHDDFPPDTEERLESFTELVATAIANAEARGTFSQLADQQAALRRVATLVAEGAAPADVFNAVAWEVAQLFDFAAVTLSYYEDDAVVVVADPQDSGFPVGSRWPFDGDSLSVRVRATGRMARIDDYSDIDGSAGARMRQRDSRSAVGVPIVVEGSLWGILCVGAAATLLLPSDIEARIAGFVELVGTAIANSQARDALHLLADEQAELRRVATLVARDAPPAQVFDAVAMGVGKLLDADIAAVGRYDDDRSITAVGSWSATPGGVPVGTGSVLGGRNVSTLVAETAMPARVDRYDDDSGEAAEVACHHGWQGSVAAPILVEGRLWGNLLVATKGTEPFPVGTEERLSAFTDLVATAIANANTKSELAASRRRIVAAADEARRRIERDLHDGIQQRLIALTFRARAMTRKPPNELPELAAELSEGLKDTSDELREISRGIHPTILTEAGLGPALRALARRSNVPIDVHVALDERLPEAIEAAAYYIASEALTNVAKHAHANVIDLVAAHDNGVLTLEVRDDGIGGVDARGGSGILGLTDRVEALGGTISIDSPPLGGTTLSVQLPQTT